MSQKASPSHAGAKSQKASQEAPQEVKSQGTKTLFPIKKLHLLFKKFQQNYLVSQKNVLE